MSKAERGDLQFALPVGYVWSPTGEIQFDPDQQVQQVVRFLFRKFEELGTLGWLVRSSFFPADPIGGSRAGGAWQGGTGLAPPQSSHVPDDTQTSPLCWFLRIRTATGRSAAETSGARAGRMVMSVDQWLVLLPNRCPAYISPEQYGRNQARLQANRARADAQGTARNGSALLASLVVCARCGCRLNVHYDGGGPPHTYECVERHTHYGEPRCQHLAGSCLDAFVSQQVLTALLSSAQPAKV